MKTTAILVLLLFAIGAIAQTENGTSPDNVTTMNTTNPTLIIPAPPIPEPFNTTLILVNDSGITNKTTTTSVTTMTIETPINASANETNETSAAENIIASVPTTTLTPTTTIAPVCGNMYQEIGEECDTTGSACGAGRWECIDCKCNRLPDETTTTTTTTTTAISVGFTLPDIGNASAIENIIPKGDNLFYLAVGAISVILIGLIVAYALGKEKENATQETKLKWK